MKDYNSHNTERLTINSTKELHFNLIENNYLDNFVIHNILLYNQNWNYIDERGQL